MLKNGQIALINAPKHVKAGKLVNKDQPHPSNLKVHRMNCPSCKNNVFANLENNSSQCTRCGWTKQRRKSLAGAKKNNRT